MLVSNALRSGELAAGMDPYVSRNVRYGVSSLEASGVVSSPPAMPLLAGGVVIIVVSCRRHKSKHCSMQNFAARCLWGPKGLRRWGIMLIWSSAHGHHPGLRCISLTSSWPDGVIVISSCWW